MIAGLVRASGLGGEESPGLPTSTRVCEEVALRFVRHEVVNPSSLRLSRV